MDLLNIINYIWLRRVWGSVQQILLMSGSLRSNCAHTDFNVPAGQEARNKLKNKQNRELYQKRSHWALTWTNNYEASNELIRAAVFRPGCVLSSWTVSMLTPAQHLMTFCFMDNSGHRDYTEEDWRGGTVGRNERARAVGLRWAAERASFSVGGVNRFRLHVILGHWSVLILFHNELKMWAQLHFASKSAFLYQRVFSNDMGKCRTSRGCVVVPPPPMRYFTVYSFIFANLGRCWACMNAVVTQTAEGWRTVDSGVTSLVRIWATLC